MSNVPASLFPLFEQAGWSEGRCVAVDAAVPDDHPAYTVLSELGGLSLHDPAANIRSIEFKYVDGAALSVSRWEEALGTKLVGIAEQDDGHGELYITGRGQVIGCSLVHPACWLVGQSVQGALEALASGENSKPILLADEDEVTLYGTRFHRGDSNVLGIADLT